MSRFEEVIESADELHDIREAPPVDAGLSVAPDPVIVKPVGCVTLFGLSNRFDAEFPTRLIGKVAPEEYAATICRINRALQRNISVNVKWLLFGCAFCCCTLGCSLWPAVFLSKKTMLSLEKVLEWENVHLYYKLGLQWKLRRVKSSNSNLSEYVLLVDFLPTALLWQPD